MVEENLWGAIDLSNWKQTPHIKNKVATEQDVIDGRAVFYIENGGKEHTPLNANIPFIAYQVDEESSTKTLVIAIQAEKVDGDQFVGVRYIEGGNGVCRWSELEIVEDHSKLNS
jgi:hypothetical protein